jgi:hypothetical protein
MERLSASSWPIRKLGARSVACAMTLRRADAGRRKQNFAELNY